MSVVSSVFGWLMGTVMGMLVSLATAIASLFAKIFSFAIDATIINFTQHFSTIQAGVDSIWLLFRDAANILFVGIFIYIAIAVLIDKQGFDPQKQVVKLVITALLINFSLFATKVVIDISNIVAIQLYKQITQGIQTDVATHIFEKTGIAKFKKESESWVDTITDTLSNANTRTIGKEAGVIAVLIYSIIVIVMSIFLVAIFVYGTFMLFSRAVGLVVIMATSAAAVAARMLPQTQKWWDMWFSKLTNYAIFAPVFMLFLWGTIIVSRGIQGDLGKVLRLAQGDFTNPEVVTALVNSVLVIGLLYVAIDVSSKLSLSGSKAVSDWAKKLQLGTVRRLATVTGKSVTAPVSAVAGMGVRGLEKAGLYTTDKLRAFNYKLSNDATRLGRAYKNLIGKNLDSALKKTNEQLAKRGLIDTKKLEKTALGQYMAMPKTTPQKEKEEKEFKASKAEYTVAKELEKAKKAVLEAKPEAAQKTVEEVKKERVDKGIIKDSEPLSAVLEKYSKKLEEDVSQRKSSIQTLERSIASIESAIQSESRKTNPDVEKISRLQKELSEHKANLEKERAKLEAVNRAYQRAKKEAAQAANKQDSELIDILTGIESEIAKLPQDSLSQLSQIQSAIKQLSGVADTQKQQYKAALQAQGLPTAVEDLIAKVMKEHALDYDTASKVVKEQLKSMPYEVRQAYGFKVSDAEQIAEAISKLKDEG